MSERVRTEDGWEIRDYGDGHILHQRACSDCDHGVLVTPGSWSTWCPHCGGSGLIVRRRAGYSKETR